MLSKDKFVNVVNNSVITSYALYGVKKGAELFVTVCTLLAYGCPVQAIVVAFGLDESIPCRTANRREPSRRLLV